MAFAAGASLGGRLVRLARPDPGRLLGVTALVEAGLIGAAAITASADAPAMVATRYSAIVLLALAMGMQNAAARRLAVADLTTTVLTLTITGLAADGRLGAGGSARLGRRSLAIGSMFIGALAGAVTITMGGAALVLVIAFAMTGGIGLSMLTRASASRRQRPRQSAPPERRMHPLRIWH